MRKSPALSRAISRGVTLIEVLVGIAIGLIGMLVMFQMVTVWDARTRISASSGDAQVAGTLAMYNLERDIRHSGMGFGPAGTAEAGCLVRAYDANAAASANFSLRPVSITDGDPGGVPDSIQILYGSSPFFGEKQDFSNGTATTIATDLKYGFKPGDLAVVTDRAGTCRMIEITDDSSPDPYILAFTPAPAQYTDFYTGGLKNIRWNSASASAPTIASGHVYSLGPNPRLNNWSVNTASTTLGFANLVGPDPGRWFGIAEGVIDMKAQYGYDADANNQISDAEWTKVPPVDWSRVRAVRVAMLLRSREFQRPAAASNVEAPTYRMSAAPAWSGGSFLMKNVDGTADTDPVGSPNNWRYYRYRVYERVVPLRNMIWGQS